MINRNDFFPFGIGTWGIGGLAERDLNINADKQIEALAHMLKKGFNYVEANYWYAQGYAVELLHQGLKKSGRKRDDIFICQAVYLKDNKLQDVESEIDRLLKLFNTDHIDSLQFTQSVFLEYGFDKACEVVEKMITKGKARFTSITNEDKDLLVKYHQWFGDKLIAHEVCYNLEIRANETEGMIPYADEHNILTVLYQPLRRNRSALRNWPLLVKLSKKYGVTQNQIILAWLLARGFLPLTKSETISHIDEHLKAIDLKIEPNDLTDLNAFNPPGYHPLKIDWQKTGEGVRVDQLSNVFDDEYAKQTKLS